MKKILKAFILCLALVFLAACSQEGMGEEGKTIKESEKNNKDLQKYDYSFYQTFDTSITYIAYKSNKTEFDEESRFVEEEFTRLHKLYDNFHSYEDLVSVKEVNDMAGKGPVKVDKDLFNLVKFSIDNYEKTLGKVNIAMGRTIKLWTDARNENQDSGSSEVEMPENDDKDIVLPSPEAIKDSGEHMDIKDIVLDEKNQTIEIKDPDMLIDLGAVGKGYATEIVAQKLIDRGVKYATINAGGNVRSIGTPGDGRTKWGVGIQNPEAKSKDFLEVLFTGPVSVVTSGDYQRYFEKDGVRYHHIIDPKTLYPGGDYNSVSILTENSGLADYLSTAMFLSTKEEAEEILENYPEVGVLWYSKKEGKSSNEYMKQFMKSENAKSQ